MDTLKTNDLSTDNNIMTTPSFLYDDVIESLRLEISLCHKLSTVVEEKLEAIVKVDAEIISRTAKEEESLAFELSDITSLRVFNTSRLAKHLDAAENIRLGELLELMEGSYKAQISELRTELIDVGTKVKRTNDMNRKILEGSQQRITDYFKQACKSTDGTYTSSGESNKRQVSFFNAEA